MAGNPENLKPFQKGHDPRRNRNGRPKSFDALRKLAQQISHEDAQSGGQPIVINGHTVTVAEALLRQLAQSKNPRDRQLFIEIAYGKVPSTVEVNGKIETWQDELIKLLREGKVSKPEVVEELGDRLAADLFQRAGIDVT